MPARSSAVASSARVRLPPVSQRALQDLAALRERRPIELEQAIVGCHAGHHARPREREHPPDVGGRHEVPRRTQHVRPQDRALIERLFDAGVGQPIRAQTQRPPGTWIVLGLHGSEPRDHLEWRLELPSREPLIQLPADEDGRRHRGGTTTARPEMRPERSASYAVTT